jgi:hypothetical protein
MQDNDPKNRLGREDLHRASCVRSVACASGTRRCSSLPTNSLIRRGLPWYGTNHAEISTEQRLLIHTLSPPHKAGYFFARSREPLEKRDMAEEVRLGLSAESRSVLTARACR